MNTRSAKNKGKRLCQDVKQKLLEFAPELKDDDVYIPVGSVPGEDIILSPLARTIFNFCIECKNQEALNIWAALKQAESHAKGTEKLPVVFFSRNRSKTYVALELDHFLKLTKKDSLVFT